MKALPHRKRNPRAGYIVSAELSLISTILVSGLMVGLVSIRNSMVGELHDTAEAFGSVSQSYQFGGTSSGTASTGGGRYEDGPDGGDGDGYSVMVAPEPETGS